jgi:hypothetical protein
MIHLTEEQAVFLQEGIVWMFDCMADRIEKEDEFQRQDFNEMMELLGGWDQLLDSRDERIRDLVTCPICGTTLSNGKCPQPAKH